jgi:predicted secreted protein
VEQLSDSISIGTRRSIGRFRHVPGRRSDMESCLRDSTASQYPGGHSQTVRCMPTIHTSFRLLAGPVGATSNGSSCVFSMRSGTYLPQVDPKLPLRRAPQKRLGRFGTAHSAAEVLRARRIFLRNAPLSLLLKPYYAVHFREIQRLDRLPSGCPDHVLYFSECRHDVYDGITRRIQHYERPV